ncbi:helix-turn-helix domain-containing protein [Paenibacillus sp. HJGM_3]|uniref:helix-turn-helix domain-containing protein n=1 Tax=Paenibacillus sp. HJGM_3 TaxID=3379816 RepID=UPI00385CD558
MTGIRIPWFGRMNRRTFYLKLIMTTILIAVIPTLISNLVAYNKVSTTFEQETGRSKQQYLNQTINAIEIVLKRIKDNAQLLGLSQSFQDFERFPNIGYYESLSGEIPPEDLPMLYSYLETKKNALYTLNAFKMSNEFVDSVYFYDSSKSLVITSENGGFNRQFPLQSFYDTEWYEALAGGTDNPFILDTRTVQQGQSIPKSLLSIVYKSAKKGNALIINLDATMIYSEIVDKLNLQDHIFAVSSSGTIMLHSEPLQIQKPLTSLVPENESILGNTGSYVTERDKQQMLVSYATSPLLQWTFVNLTDLKALSGETLSIKQTIIWSALLLILFSMALSYISSRSLYKPISRLNALTGARLERKSEHNDEIHRIGSFVQSTIDERDYYKEKLEESLPFYREQFKYSLLHKHSLTLDEIEKKKAYLGIEIGSHDLVLLLLMLEDGSNRHSEPDVISGDLYMMRVMDAIQNSRAIQVSYFLVHAEKDKIAIVLSGCGTDCQQVEQLAQHLLDELKAELQADFTIGVGRVCPSIQDLPQAYEESLEALKYRMIYGKGNVISVDEIGIDTGSDFSYPKQKAELLLSHIKTAREAEALRIFEEIVAEISDHRTRLHYNQIQPLFVQLLTEFMNTYNQLGADIRAIFGGGADPYRELLDQESLDKISRWFRSLIHSTTVYIEQELNAKGNHHIARVIEILERDYNRDISLNSVGEQLNLNPAYISRLFKQITGQPFVEYLKRVRIEKSKELLSQSNMKINEVSKQVGYENSYYFIKVFKDMMGLTPGEYKKLVGS